METGEGNWNEPRSAIAAL